MISEVIQKVKKFVDKEFIIINMVFVFVMETNLWKIKLTMIALAWSNY